MARKKTSMDLDEGILKELKVFGVYNDLSIGQSVEALMIFANSLTDMDLPEDVKNKLDVQLKDSILEAVNLDPKVLGGFLGESGHPKSWKDLCNMVKAAEKKESEGK